MADAPVFLGLGSNQGDSAGTLRAALGVLDSVPGVRVRGVSSLYRTAPVGFTEQPAFLNLVAYVHTSLTPHELLRTVQALERSFGRVRDRRWGPRTLDIDILWYDGLSLRETDLELPHPRVGERRFVLEPLAELAPDLELPDGRTVREALEAVGDQEVERVASLPLGTGEHEATVDDEQGA